MTDDVNAASDPTESETAPVAEAASLAGEPVVADPTPTPAPMAAPTPEPDPAASAEPEPTPVPEPEPTPAPISIPAPYETRRSYGYPVYICTICGFATNDQNVIKKHTHQEVPR